MKTIVIGAAVTTALALSGLSARASCVDPRAASQPGTPHEAVPLYVNEEAIGDHSGQNAREAIVGTWHVAYTAEGSPTGDAFIQWHSDGTEWENINYPVLGGNICMGSWKSVDRSHVYRNHWGWLFNNGIVAGYFNETETDEVAAHGNSYTGYNEIKFYDLKGNLTMQVTGTASATRIAP